MADGMADAMADGNAGKMSDREEEATATAAQTTASEMAPPSATNPPPNVALHRTLAMRRGYRSSEALCIQTDPVDPSDPWEAASASAAADDADGEHSDATSSSFDTDAHDVESDDFELQTGAGAGNRPPAISDDASDALGFCAAFADEPNSARRQQSYDSVKRKVSFGSGETVGILLATTAGKFGHDELPTENPSAAYDPEHGAESKEPCSSESESDNSEAEVAEGKDAESCGADAFAESAEVAAIGGGRVTFASPRTMQERLRRRKRSISIFATNFMTLASVGSGSFGDVFCCRCRADGRRYALKRARQRFRGHRERASMLREYDVGAALAIGAAHADDAAGADAPAARPHPHLVAYYSAWQEDGYIHIQVRSPESCTAFAPLLVHHLAYALFSHSAWNPPASPNSS